MATVDEARHKYRDAELLATFDGTSGTVRLYGPVDDADPIRHLVFQFDDWMLDVWDYTRPVEFGAPLTTAQLESLAAAIVGEVDPAGHLVLTVAGTDAVTMCVDRSVAVLGTEQSGLIEIFKRGCVETASQRLGEYIVTCNGQLGLRAVGSGDEEFVTALDGFAID